MKITSVLLAASLVSASAFVPSSNARQSTQLHESIFKTISNMDLFAPVKDQNDYGARGKKNLTVGKLTEKSYVPQGLTKAQYEKIRKQEVTKKEANYQKNVKKAGKFIDFTDWYTKRGTNLNQSWVKAPNKGHLMAKTKFDWSGTKIETPLYTGVQKKDAAPKKK